MPTYSLDARAAASVYPRLPFGYNLLAIDVFNFSLTLFRGLTCERVLIS